MEDDVEGEELQKLAMLNKVEKERLEAIRRDEKQQLMEDNRKQIDERTALRKLQENQEDVSHFLSAFEFSKYLASVNLDCQQSDKLFYIFKTGKCKKVTRKLDTMHTY